MYRQRNASLGLQHIGCVSRGKDALHTNASQPLVGSLLEHSRLVVNSRLLARPSSLDVACKRNFATASQLQSSTLITLSGKLASSSSSTSSWGQQLSSSAYPC